MVERVPGHDDRADGAVGDVEVLPYGLGVRCSDHGARHHRRRGESHRAEGHAAREGLPDGAVRDCRARISKASAIDDHEGDLVSWAKRVRPASGHSTSLLVPHRRRGCSMFFIPERLRLRSSGTVRPSGEAPIRGQDR
jgi:hypothetical protein